MLLSDVQMRKPSYAQIAQKSKEMSTDIVNSSEYDDMQVTAKDAIQSSSSSAGVEPRPQRSGPPTADSRPSHTYHAHSHGRQRASGHVASADEMRHRDYNGVASAARPLP